MNSDSLPPADSGSQSTLKWISVKDKLPHIVNGHSRTGSMVLARSLSLGVVALWLARARLDALGEALYSGQGDQRLWVNGDRWQSDNPYPQDIVEWAEIPGSVGNTGQRPLY